MKLVLQQPGVREVNVKLMLAGGQMVAIKVAADNPLLASLFTALSPQSSATPRATLYQIPIEGGKSSLAFSSDRLVAIVTDPAVVVQEESGASSPTADSLPDASPAGDALPIVRHPVVQLDGFLPEAEVTALLEAVFAAQERFIPSDVSDGKADYRQSLVMLAPESVAAMMSAKIRAVMPNVMSQLRMPPFPVGRIETQVTASNDGAFFRVHTDAGHNETIKRQLTYVYYFNRRPKGFTGGELRIYDDRIRNNKLARADSFQVVEPRHNSIVFFQAAIMHEVVPVAVPSKDFRDSRFTVNGWIDRT
jgi:Rps23 Pro-64 3,4-dihydroxylase Tpa1-like proline 4-hydroxylase